MTSKLVKKSLELFNDDFKSNEEPVKKRKKINGNPMSQISSKKKGVKKELKRLQREVVERQRKNQGLRPAVKGHLTFDHEDHTEASVRSLTNVSKLSKVGDKAINAIVNHHLTRNNKEPIKKKKKKKNKDLKNKKKETKAEKEQGQSLFTDDDFEKFFAEYNDPLNKR